MFNNCSQCDGLLMETCVNQSMLKKLKQLWRNLMQTAYFTPLLMLNDLL